MAHWSAFCKLHLVVSVVYVGVLIDYKHFLMVQFILFRCYVSISYSGKEPMDLHDFVPNYARFRQMWRNFASDCNSRIEGVYFTMHQCNVTCAPRKPFSGQCNLSFTAISLNLDACFEWFTSVLNCRWKGQNGQIGA